MRVGFILAAVSSAAVALSGCAAPNVGEVFGEARHRVAVYDSLVNDVVVISCDARNARGELEARVGEVAVRCLNVENGGHDWVGNLGDVR